MKPPYYGVTVAQNIINDLGESRFMELARCTFKKGKQKKFLDYIKRSSGVGWTAVSSKLKVNEGTMKSYRNEYCQIPYSLFERVCDEFSLNKNETLVKYNGEKVVYEIGEVIGTKGYRLGTSRNQLKDTKISYAKKNLKLKTSQVSYSNRDKEKRILLPKKITPLLAEEVGISLGDGFLSDKKYTFRVKGDNKQERGYYDKFIRPMYKQLFNIELNLKQYDTVYGFEIYSKALWEFKTKVLGIQAGVKNDIGIPTIFKVWDEAILCSLVRGYFDTDGCVSFITRYGYKKFYPVINVISKSRRLIEDYNEIILMLGFNPCKYRTKNGYWTIFLYGYGNFERYKKMIGWSNPKNLRKVEEWGDMYGCGSIAWSSTTGCGPVNPGSNPGRGPRLH